MACRIKFILPLIFIATVPLSHASAEDDFTTASNSFEDSLVSNDEEVDKACLEPSTPEEDVSGDAPPSPEDQYCFCPLDEVSTYSRQSGEMLNDYCAKCTNTPCLKASCTLHVPSRPRKTAKCRWGNGEPPDCKCPVDAKPREADIHTHIVACESPNSFECAKKFCKVYLKDANGEAVGDALGTPFVNGQPKELLCNE